METQWYSSDYDGVIAGAPPLAWTRLLSFGAASIRALTDDPAASIPTAKLPTIQAAARAAVMATTDWKMA